MSLIAAIVGKILIECDQYLIVAGDVSDPDGLHDLRRFECVT